MNPIRDLRSRAGLTQAELAAAANTSQPAIAAYETRAKSPTLRTLARLAAAVHLELVVSFTRPLTREDRRSLALHRAVAARLASEPGPVLNKARRNLATMRGRHPGASGLFDHWAVLLQLPPTDLADVLVDPSPWARELRQVTPFAGVLTPAERTAAYRRFAAEEDPA